MIMHCKYRKRDEENEICFQTPLSKMQVFYSSGSFLYNSVTQASEDLQKPVILVGKFTTEARTNETTEEMLKRLLQWKRKRKIM
ncbi:hypothetical protein GOODEAATRI_032769, partial [Goodea atripinnis]